MNFVEKMAQIIHKIESSSTPQQPFDLFGIEVGFGWYGLILPIINAIRVYNEQHPRDPIDITQIKEKFGTLRFYTSSIPDHISGMIQKAEEESKYICELCGARGKLTEFNGWYITLCDDHIKARTEGGYDDALLKNNCIINK